jgi:hypothetical protein
MFSTPFILWGIGFWCGVFATCALFHLFTHDGGGYQPEAPAGFKGSGKPPRGGSGAKQLPC